MVNLPREAELKSEFDTGLRPRAANVPVDTHEESCVKSQWSDSIGVLQLCAVCVLLRAPRLNRAADRVRSILPANLELLGPEDSEDEDD